MEPKPKPIFGEPAPQAKPELLIRHASTELASKALETFPLDVDRWTAEFTAVREDSCLVPVLPGTKLRWTNSNIDDVLVPAPNQFDFWHSSRRAELPDPLIRGIRFATHEFEAGGDDSYSELKRRFMDQLAESGYGLRQASVQAEDGRIGLDISDTVEGQNISLSISDREIVCYQDFSEAVEKELREWFERLNQSNKREQPTVQKTF